MKIKTFLTLAALAASPLAAAPLNGPAAVQLLPDASSPVILVLSAGTEQPAPSVHATAVPEGWQAVDLPGPFTAYVKNKDLTKQLDVMPGASVYIGPKEDSGVLTVFAKGDKAEITGLHGGWTQIRISKPVVGYISTSPQTPVAAHPMAPTAPTAPAAAPVAAAAAPAPAPAPTGSSESIRIFEGKFVSSETFLYPHRPYKWELDDASGHRIAYVNLQGILLTDQVENYADHTVVILGTLRPAKESRDLVIDVEAFHLK
jgi:hypothetical protein